MDEDEPVAEPTDRGYWESKRASKKTLTTTDSLLKLGNEVEPKANLKYNKGYIGLEIDGSPLNFVTFIPRKAHVIMEMKLPQSKEVDEQLEEVGLETLTYESHWGQYRLRIESDVDEKQRETLIKLIRQAREGFGRRA